MRIPGLKSIAPCLLSAALLFSPALRASAQSPQPAAIQSFSLVSPTSGWLLADGRLFWTASTGSQWTEITPPAPAGASIAGASFRANGDGLAVEATPDGAALNIARTTDSGAHWVASTLAAPFSAANPFGGKAYPAFADDQNGWLLLTLQSSSAFRLGLLFRTTDGGLTWTQLPTPPIGADLTFTDATHGFMGPGPAGDELYATSDAGQTWHTVALPAASATLTSTPSTITLPSFTDTQHGSLIRTYRTDATPTAVLYQTADAGLTWTSSTQTASNLIAVATNGAVTAAITPVRPQADLTLFSSNSLLPTRSSFATASSGWVLFEGGDCDASQGLCTQTSELMGTLDGGKTFFALGQPSGITLQTTSSFAIPKSHSTATPFLVPGGPQPDSSVSVQGAMGFDACTLPTTSEMQTWYTSSPYRVIGAYIGGSEFACKSGLGNFTAAWTSTILGMGFEIMPIWVGPQAPGNGSKFSFLMSTDPATAFSQGVTEADSAIAAMTARGMGQGSSIIYDIEAYSYSVPANVAGTQSFLEGWDTELHAKGYIAGVYSSHPEFDTWTPPMLSPAIDIISFAYFFNSGVACGTTCQTVFPTQTSSFDLPANYWLNHHRNRQTSSGFNSTYGSVKLNIDEDWTDASMVVATPNTLTVNKTGSGTGTVVSTQVSNSIDTSIDTAINCASACATANSTFAATDTVTLTATADAGSTFTSWTGCTSTSGATCTVLVAASTTVAANFTANVVGYTLTVTKAGTGSGTVTSSDSSINCGSTCSASYAAATAVTLTATPSAGSVFSGWTGCTLSSGNSCSVTMAAAEAVTATFSPAPTFSAALSSTSLTVTGGQTATDTLTFTPQSGYTGTFNAFSCTGLPASATCAFNPTTLTATGNGAALSTTLTITTSASAQLLPPSTHANAATIVLASLFAPALLLLPFSLRRRRLNSARLRHLLLFVIACSALGLTQLLTGCGGGSSANTPTGPIFSGTIQVNFTSSAGTTQLPVQLTINR